MRHALPALLFSPLLPLTAAAEVRFVDAGALGAADGTSWADAFPDLQPALAAAQPGDELWVAAGVYAPSTDDATASFVLRDGVALLGGFAGTETASDQRDWLAHETILTGDIGHDDEVGSGLYWYVGWNIHTANAGHVLYAEGIGATAVLDGFTVQNGHTGPAGTPSSSELMLGGGLFCRAASPTVRNCTFLHNEAAFGPGGAVYLIDSSPVIEDCRLLENYAHLGSGAGLYSGGTSAPRIARCELARNVAVAGSGDVQGAGMYHAGSAPIEIEDCLFEDNRATQFYPVSTHVAYGGGLASWLAGITVKGCVFRRNQAQYGGGLITWGPTTVVNCLFVENEAYAVPADPYPEIGGEGAGVMVNAFQPVVMRVVHCTLVANKGKKHVAVMGGWNATAQIEGSIAWNNVATHPEVQGGYEVDLGGNFDAAYSCVKHIFDPPMPGEDPIDPANLPGCIDVDPHLVAPADPRLAAGSPCIDAARNDLLPADAVLDLQGGGRFQDDPSAPDTGAGAAPLADMGAYERLADALTADRATLSLAPGGAQHLSLDAGPGHAGEGYWVVGSLSGTWPGFDVLGVHLPLNPDAYFALTLAHPSQGFLVGTLGLLDAAGRATARIELPPGSPAAWSGLALDHAFVAFGGAQPTFASGTAPLALVP